MAKISTSDFQKGMFIEFKEEIHQIVEFQHVNPGKGSAFVRTKLRNLNSGNTLEFTYKSGEQVTEIPVFVKELQYLYQSDDNYYFMDNKSFEQTSLKQKILGNFSQYLKTGETYQIYTKDDQAIGIKIPKKVKLKVTEAEAGFKGNTVSGAKKQVKVETGLTISVPLFIKKGDLIAVDPQTDEYLERVN